MAIWPDSHMANMASNVENMCVFGYGNTNVAIWWEKILNFFGSSLNNGPNQPN
jgi:hypothetical protein